MTQFQTPRQISKFSCTTSLLVLIFFMLLCGYFSLILGKDLDFDLANYHFYIPYAFLHHRLGFDYWPGSFFQAYLVPTADFITYFLINYFNARWATILSGAIHGICFWLVFLIARVLLPDSKRKDWLALLLAGLSLYAPFVLLMIGKFHNDLTVGIFILGFILLQLRVWQGYQQQQKIAWGMSFAAAFLLGIALGLKLTSAIFVLGGAVALLLMPVQKMERVKMIAIFAIGVALGDLLAAGYWMWIMWQKFHNPFYPFFNSIFHSPDFQAKSWRYTEYVPENIWKMLFFPFYFSFHGTLVDGYFRDVRFLLVYVFLLLGAAVLLWRKLVLQKTITHDYPLRWLIILFVTTFALNEYYFSILRYVLVLEMLAPILIYLLLQKIISEPFLRRVTFFICAYFIIILMLPIPGARATWYGTSYFDQVMPTAVHRTPRATVLLAYPAYTMESDPRPQTFLIPYFPPQWRFVGIPFLHYQYIATDQIARNKTIAIIRQNHDPYYLLTTKKFMPKLVKAVNTFGLQLTGKCEYISNHRAFISEQPVVLCPAKLI